MSPATKKVDRPPAPGARLEVRGEEWVLRRADRTFDGHYVLSVTGLSPLVRDQDWKFLTELDAFTEVDPKQVILKHDESAGYAAAKLHIECLLRTTPPTDEFLYLGHRGAMDDVPYQRLPALLALEQPRPRILIADGTGLGKTLEAGILIAELMRRGRGRRILVVTLKSMLTQFQKELWSRFAIPLVRLDSLGIQRVRDKIPVGHNPFNHFDKSIISIDTLKSASDYRVFIEQAYWDIIVIDEAQNVANRGTRSLRNQLANLLASRSDALIMLSATPHDGRARSFASLMGMLDPTAIADPDNYTKDDLEGKHLFVRRFKKDIQHEAKSAFQERKTSIQRALATELEEAVFAALVDKANRQLTVRERTGWLFQTVLEKAVLSSPAACLETVRNRIKRLEKQGKGPKFTGPLQRISQLLTQVRPNSHSKYQCLLKMLRAWNWTGKDTRDRVVVFTERIATLNFLQENLVRDLGLNDGAVRVLKGTLSDSEQQEIVEAFGSTQTPIRLLLSTDVGSEGINLHYHCCKLIHFDIPWSLMVLQQRNGRIDRYGQERQPQIVYLLTESETAKFKDDQRILEILIDKEWQAHKNIGDPASLMGLYDTEAEVRKVGETIERDMSAGRAESNLFGHQGNTTKPFDPVAALLGATPLNVDQSEHKTRAMPSLYASDYAYLKAALMTIKSDRVTGRSLDFDLQYWDREQRLQFTAPVAMTGVIETLPVEARPKQRLFDLSGRAMDMMQEIKSCRSTESTWPQKHYLWPLHPMMDWTTDKVRLFFRRREAPIIALRDMGARQVGYVISASYSNRKGHTVYQKWYLIQAKDGECVDVVPFDDSREFRSLRSRNLTNAGCDDRVIEAASRFLPEAIDWASVFVDEKREEFVAKVEPKLDEHLRRLLQLEVHHEAHVEAKYTATDPLTAGRKAIELRRVRSKFDEYQTWIRDTMHIEETPFIQVVAVLVSH